MGGKQLETSLPFYKRRHTTPLLSKKLLDLLDHVVASLLDHVHILNQSLRGVARMQEIISGKLTVYSKEVGHNVGN